MHSPPSLPTVDWQLFKLVLGLLLSTALMVVTLPLFNSLLLEAEVNAATRSLVQDIARARAAAITTNHRVQWLIHLGNAHSSGIGIALAVHPAGASEITFNGLGWSVANADGTPSIATIDVQPGGWPHSGLHNRRVQLSSAGDIVLCDPHHPGATQSSC